ESTAADEFQKKFKFSLMKKFECLNGLMLKQENRTLLNEIYTELYITEGDSGDVNKENEVKQIEAASRRNPTEDTPIKCSDIFKPLPEQDEFIRSVLTKFLSKHDEEPIRNVLTKGVAGIGKTVSVQKFVLDWAEGKTNQDVHLIFPLPFRELNLMKEQKLSLMELLHVFFKEMKEIDISRLEKVLFIFDGLDELKCVLLCICRLEYCGVSDEGCAALASALRSNPSHLRELNLTVNKVGDSGVKCLSAVLENPHCKLEILGVEECVLAISNVVGCKNIVSASSLNCAIVVFLNSLNKVTKLVQKGIVLNNELKCVSLCICRLKHCGVSDEGCAALASALRSNPSHLRKLYLTENNVGDSGVKCVSAVLENPHCKLEILWLRDCGVSDEGCAALASALRSNPSHLRDLNLYGNKVGDSGVKFLSDLKDDKRYKLQTLNGPRLSWHINCLEMMAVFLGLQHFLPGLRDRHVLVRTDNTAVVSYINHQGGLRSRPLYKLARAVLLWSQDRFLSLRAIYIPGRLNVRADALSRQGPRPGEWRLHPEVVELVWRRFYRAQVDLFATQETSHCPLWFSLSHPAPLGLDAMVQSWPRLRLYAFPPIALLP
ncbi:NACHT, LRR and PYD domains-containing protein 12-like, partial [Silurus meridionalis]